MVESSNKLYDLCCMLEKLIRCGECPFDGECLNLDEKREVSCAEELERCIRDVCSKSEPDLSSVSELVEILDRVESVKWKDFRKVDQARWICTCIAEGKYALAISEILKYLELRHGKADYRQMVIDNVLRGKGYERHRMTLGNKVLRWVDTPMFDIMDSVGIGFTTGQAMKKVTEAQVIYDRCDKNSHADYEDDAAMDELIEAIVYLAGAIYHSTKGKC